MTGMCGCQSYKNTKTVNTNNLIMHRVYCLTHFSMATGPVNGHELFDLCWLVHFWAGLEKIMIVFKITFFYLNQFFIF